MTALTDRIRLLLEQEPLTRQELESRMGIAQQRASEVLRKVGAHVVGYKPAPRQGRPAPIYAIGETRPVSRGWSFGAVSSVFDLGSRA